MRFLSVLILGMLLPSLAEGAVIVRFHGEAQPSGMLVRLGDIADIAAETEAERTRLGELTLSPGPAVGRKLRLTVADVRNRLQALGIDLSDVEFGGASSVLVSGAEAEPEPPAQKPLFRPLKPVRTSEATLQRLEDRLSREILAEIGRRSPGHAPLDVTVDLTLAQAETIAAACGAPVEAVAGSLEPSLGKLAGGDSPWTGQMQFRLMISTAAGTISEVPITATLAPWPRVVVTRAHVVKGRILTAADILTRPVAPRSVSSGALAEPGAVVGRQVTRTIREGESITPEMIREVPLVRRGETVTVTARRGGIAVRSEAKAGEDGAFGQTIPLISRDGKQRLLGRVVAFHEVETVATPGEPVGMKLIQTEGATPAPSTLGGNAIRQAGYRTGD